MPLELLRFQSTLPARGATGRPDAAVRVGCHFNPRSPHGERPVADALEAMSEGISIHAPRTGSDPTLCCAPLFVRLNFNPRSPHGERLVSPDGFMAGVAHFNPRSPHGERRATSG